MYQSRMRPLLVTIAIQVIFIALVLMTGRYFMLHYFAVPAELAKHSDDVTRMWSIGVRYDLRIGGLFMSPFLLVGFLFCANRFTWRVLKAISPYLMGLIMFLVVMVTISNFYYYQTYHNHFDIFAFGIVNDDTQNVLLTIWQDYPVIRAVLCGLLLAFISFRLAKHTLRDKARQHWHTGIFIIYLLIATIVLAIASRGSVGTFPLRRGNAQVSQLLILNKLSPNGFMALDWAINDKKADESFAPVSHERGKALEAQLGISGLDARTPVNPWLAQHKPNVVMTVMESFGSNMLDFDEPGVNDLLGHLRPHFKEDFVFKRFLSEDNGTAPSLAAMLFHSPFENISHSSEQKVTLHGVPFDVYKKAGYKTIFISPGNMAWRNLVNYLPRQGVDEVYDQNTLMEMYPQSASELGAWGVPDDYAFRLAEKLLSEKSKKPLFITILTITNHPPYETPKRYHPAPYALTPEVLKHSADTKASQKNILETYQFAADAFGQFVSAVEASPAGDHTIIASTGDHQMRRLNAFYPQEQVLDRAVPFYLHVPKSILAHTKWTYDPNRVGSHKDIFPTLYNLSLSDTPYQAIAGRNMLAPVDDPSRAFGYNVTLWIDKNGAYPMSGNPAFYPWATATGLRTKTKSMVPSEQQQERQKALPELLRWQLNSQVKGFTDKSSSPIKH
ncbi:LTA synthase family protein [Marinomonas spartinae]|uniref:LTA synthase family protein n=1 Tax=Marinomonas spartinae TaxID=1792290 RepID=UPI0018F20850|nr:alkaline phosphatase family protein [Marinomonas spartinae]MBJ7556024.1 sulfatase-like hydrolase/transferase [Marinomonas spartinae]